MEQMELMELEKDGSNYDEKEDDCGYDEAITIMWQNKQLLQASIWQQTKYIPLNYGFNFITNL